MQTMTKRQPLSSLKSFESFFASAKRWSHKPGDPPIKPLAYMGHNDDMPISRYMIVRKVGEGLEYRTSLEVEARLDLLEVIDRHMLQITGGVYRHG